jgi:hypothetical protein
MLLNARLVVFKVDSLFFNLVSMFDVGTPTLRFNEFGSCSTFSWTWFSIVSHLCDKDHTTLMFELWHLNKHSRCVHVSDPQTSDLMLILCQDLIYEFDKLWCGVRDHKQWLRVDVSDPQTSDLMWILCQYLMCASLANSDVVWHHEQWRLDELSELMSDLQTRILVLGVSHQTRLMILITSNNVASK